MVGSKGKRKGEEKVTVTFSLSGEDTERPKIKSDECKKKALKNSVMLSVAFSRVFYCSIDTIITILRFRTLKL